MQQLQLDNKDGEKLQCNTTTKYVKYITCKLLENGRTQSEQHHQLPLSTQASTFFFTFTTQILQGSATTTLSALGFLNPT